MNCKECGATLEREAKFCQNCGAKVEIEEPTVKTPIADAEAESMHTETKRESIDGVLNADAIKGKGQKLSQKAKIAIGAVAAVILLVIILAVSGGKTICLSDYASVNFTGYDTVGKAVVQIDEDRLYTDFAKKASKKNSQVDWEIWFGDYAYRSALENNASYKLSASESLCNGDMVQLTWTINTDAIKSSFGVKVTAKDSEYKVNNLPTPIPFDPFEDVSIKFEGADTEGKLTSNITSDKEIYEDLYFNSDRWKDLSNGETITIALCTKKLQASDDIETYCIEKYGMQPTVTAKEYTVEGLGHYITSDDEVSDKVIDQIKVHDQESFKHQFESAEDANRKTLINTEYLGYYVFFPKDDSSHRYGTINNICNIYKATVEFNRDGLTEEKEYYTYLFYEDVSVNTEGVCSADWSDYYFPTDIVYSTFLKWGYPRVNGFETFQELEEDFNHFDFEDYNCIAHLEGNA